MTAASGLRQAVLLVSTACLAMALLGCTGDAEEPAAADRPADRSGAPSGDGETDAEGPGDSDGSAETSGDDGAPSRKDGRQEDTLSRLPGPDTARCVDVGSRRDVRSGDFAAGPFDEVSGPKGVRLYFIPATAPSGASLEVDAERLDGSGAVSWSQDVYSDANQVKFFDTTTTFPRSGTWRLQVRAGSNRGCFVAAIG